MKINSSKKGYIARGIGILASLYYGIKSKIKNPNVFDDKELPIDIKNILDAHGEEIVSIKGYGIFDFLSDYIIKEDKHNRMRGAKAISVVIDQYHLKKLFVPKKYLYVAPDGRRFIIAKLVEQSKEPITKEELEELIFLANKLRWLDIKYENFLKTSQGIALIDTESDVMDKERLKYYTTIDNLSKRQWFKIKKLFLPVLKKEEDENDIFKKQEIIRVFYYNAASCITPEAKKYLEERMEGYRKKTKKV